MNHLPIEQSWLTLTHLLNDLKSNDADIPGYINNELGIIRSQISSYKRDPTHPDLINELARADMSLNEVQGVLLSLAAEISSEYEDEWLDKLGRAMRGEEVYPMPQDRSKYIVNVPPGFSYARITLKNPISEDRVQEIAEEYGLIIEFDSDVTIAIYGDKAVVQTAIKEMAPFFQE